MAITTDSEARQVLARITADPQLGALESLPLIPPVNLGLTLGVWALFLLSSVAYLNGWLPLWITIPLSAMAIYASFTPLHDATHRAVSSNAIVNDLIGTLAATLLIPGLSTRVYRVLHLEHHRWAGDTERDPDTPLVHTRWPWLPLALALPDLVWAKWWIQKLWPHRTPRERFAFFASLGLHLVFVTACLLSPYGGTFLVVYLIPQKVGIMLVAYSFAHIQHPEGVDWKSAPLLSTGVITTAPRRLMTWVMLGQNDHHIHHLLPHLPWHRYRHVWQLGEGVLHAQNLAERGLFKGYDDTVIAAARTCFDARIESVQSVANGVRTLVFVPAKGTHFPAFTAGAHIDVHLPSGRIRQYSLCNDPRERNRFQIAVKHDPNGRGGSSEVHTLTVGMALTVGAPRNLFALHTQAKHVVLVAGGIGITPLLAMAHTLHAAGTPFALHVCARSAADVPFGAQLSALPFAAQISLHLDGAPGFDPVRDVSLWQPDHELYLCGPAGFMQFVAQAVAARGWPDAAVHTESFGAAPSTAAENRPFDLVLQRSDKIISVSADVTIIDALRGHGIHIPTACLQGVCGRCVTPIVEGEVEHRDAVLTPDQRACQMCVCVSRAKGDRLVIDA